MAPVVVEPPVLAVVDLAHLPVLALAQVVARRARRRAHRVQLPLLALLLLLLLLAKAPLLVPVVVGLAELPVAAHLVVEPQGPVEQLLLSRQSFSAARARSSP